MGRRYLVALAVAGLPLAAATPAFAQSHKSTSHGKTLVVSSRVGRTRALDRLSRHAKSEFAKQFSFPTLNDTELATGFNAECTAPNGPGASGSGQNLRSTDTQELRSGNYLALVLTCTADLKVTKSTSGTAISYNTTTPVAAVVNSCGLYSSSAQTTVVPGTGISVTYPDGLFTETCTSEFPPL
jgi:hypothetical protein